MSIVEKILELKEVYSLKNSGRVPDFLFLDHSSNLQIMGELGAFPNLLNGITTIILKQNHSYISWQEKSKLDDVSNFWDGFCDEIEHTFVDESTGKREINIFNRIELDEYIHRTK